MRWGKGFQGRKISGDAVGLINRARTSVIVRKEGRFEFMDRALGKDGSGAKDGWRCRRAYQSRPYQRYRK